LPIDISSTVKIALAQPIYAGAVQQPSSGGTTIRHFESTDISRNASTQPGITPLTGKDEGVPRSTELSKTVPSINEPV
jgi:hypothetical protein